MYSGAASNVAWSNTIQYGRLENSYVSVSMSYHTVRLRVCCGAWERFFVSFTKRSPL